MKAVCITRYNEPEQALEVVEKDIPKLRADQILVRVKAVSINPIDYKFVTGVLRLAIKLKMPATVGYDFCGVVTAVGKKATKHEIGDAVFGVLPNNSMGSLAEFLVIKESFAEKKPNNLSFEEAASLPLVGNTVIQVFKAAHLPKNAHVLIHAGSGGVGTFAIQYAKSLGYHVSATTSTTNIDFVKSLGADVVIDYKTTDYRKHLLNLDFVFDTLGGSHKKDGFKVLKENGILVSIVAVRNPELLQKMKLPWFVKLLFGWQYKKLVRLAAKSGVRYAEVLQHPTQKDIHKIFELATNGTIKPQIDSVFRFLDFADAFEQVGSGRARGKVIVTLQEL